MQLDAVDAGVAIPKRMFHRRREGYEATVADDSRAGPACDTICGYLDACCAPCEVCFRCGVPVGESMADAQTRLERQASQEENWTCDESGERFFSGPATCNGALAREHGRSSA